ncbi:hypothetical protein ACWEQL_23165 [Kitasatospora sp. NPDC004240]
MSGSVLATHDEQTRDGPRLTPDARRRPGFQHRIGPGDRGHVALPRPPTHPARID